MHLLSVCLSTYLPAHSLSLTWRGLLFPSLECVSRCPFVKHEVKLLPQWSGEGILCLYQQWHWLFSTGVLGFTSCALFIRKYIGGSLATSGDPFTAV